MQILLCLYQELPLLFLYSCISASIRAGDSFFVLLLMRLNSSTKELVSSFFMTIVSLSRVLTAKIVLVEAPISSLISFGIIICPLSDILAVSIFIFHHQ